MGWGDIVSRAGKNYTKQVNTNAIRFESTDFWHRLNATRQIKCTSLHYIAFNLPTVAFTLSGDLNPKHPFFKQKTKETDIIG